MYLVFKAGGHPAQANLWRWLNAERLILHDLNGDEIARMISLMEKYDATLMDGSGGRVAHCSSRTVSYATHFCLGQRLRRLPFGGWIRVGM
jgi:hypothetical protein